MLAVHEALGELEQRDPLKAQIVLLRYFTGLTTDLHFPRTVSLMQLAA